MDGLKGFAEIAKHILYEVLGLLIPGGAFALGVAAVVDPSRFSLLLNLSAQRPWLAALGAYLLGYVVQAISRPVTTAFEYLLKAPAGLLRLAAPLVLPEHAGRWFGERVNALEVALTGRHAHRYAQAGADEAVEFESLMHDHWHQRLGLTAGRRLSPSQLRDLSFSEILADRDRLDRFRAAASLARGVACAASVVTVIVAWQLAVRERPMTSVAAGLLLLLLVAFYGLMERADMYDRMWNGVLRSQFLCAASRGRQLGTTTAAPQLAQTERDLTRPEPSASGDITAPPAATARTAPPHALPESTTHMESGPVAAPAFSIITAATPAHLTAPAAAASAPRAEAERPDSTPTLPAATLHDGPHSGASNGN